MTSTRGLACSAIRLFLGHPPRSQLHLSRVGKEFRFGDGTAFDFGLGRSHVATRLVTQRFSGPRPVQEEMGIRLLHARQVRRRLPLLLLLCTAILAGF